MTLSTPPATRSAVIDYVNYLVDCRMAKHNGQPEPLTGFNPAVLREFISLKMTKKDDVGSPTPLHWVARHCSEQVIEALLTRLLEMQNAQEEKKYDQSVLLDNIIVLVDDVNNSTLFHFICQKNIQSPTLISKLNSLTSREVFNQELEKQNKFGMTPLHCAAMCENSAAFRILIAAAGSKAIGSTLVIRGKNRHSNVLHIAARDQDSAAFRALITTAGSTAVSEALVAEVAEERGGFTSYDLKRAGKRAERVIRALLPSVPPDGVIVDGRKAGLHVIARYQDFAAITKLIEIASPFALASKWGGVAEERINGNSKLNPDEKTQIIKLFKEHYSFVEHPKNSIQNNSQAAFITFIKHYLGQETWCDADKWIALLKKAHSACPTKETKDLLATLLAGRCLRHYNQVRKYKKEDREEKDENEKYINEFFQNLPINSSDIAPHCTPEDNFAIADYLYHAPRNRTTLPVSLALLSDTQLKMRALMHCHEAINTVTDRDRYKNHKVAVDNAIDFLNARTEDKTYPLTKDIELTYKDYQEPIDKKTRMLEDIYKELKVPIAKENNKKIIDEILDRFYAKKRKEFHSKLEVGPEAKKDTYRIEKNYYATLRETLGALIDESNDNALKNYYREGNFVLFEKGVGELSESSSLIKDIQILFKEISVGEKKLQEQKYENPQVAKNDIFDNSILYIQYYTACLTEILNPSLTLFPKAARAKDDMSSIVEELRQFADHPNRDKIDVMITKINDALLKYSTPAATTSDIRTILLKEISTSINNLREPGISAQPEFKTSPLAPG